MNLDWHFSFPMTSICCEQMYTQICMHIYCPLFIHLLGLIFSVHSVSPTFSPVILNLSYTLFIWEKNKNSVSSRASYGVIFTILLSQHLLVGQRPPSRGCKQIVFYSMNWNRRKWFGKYHKGQKNIKGRQREKKVKTELSQFMSSHCQVGTFSRTSQLSYLT